MSLNVSAHYYDTPPGSYELRIYKCDSRDKVWETGNISGYNYELVKELECDLGSGWVSLPASGMKCAGDDFSEWKTEILADEIHIYDLKPQF